MSKPGRSGEGRAIQLTGGTKGGARHAAVGRKTASKQWTRRCTGDGGRCTFVGTKAQLASHRKVHQR